MSFSTDINAFTKKTGISGTTVLRKLGFLALRGVIFRSPVDTGRFRASNRLSINKPGLGVAKPSTGESFASGEASGAVLGTAITKLATVKWGDSLHITNNLPYAIALEGGHSKQAPQGVYGLTFQDLIENFAATVASVRNSAKGK